MREVEGRCGVTRKRVADIALSALRMALAFALAFGTMLWAQGAMASDAFAQDSSGSITPGTPDDDGDGDGVGGSSSAAAKLHIADIGVFRTGTMTNAIAYASESGKSRDEVRATIDQRGGQIDFDAAIQWDDGSAWEYETDKVKWSIDEAGAKIARITPSGILEAAGTDDGIVVVTASVDGSYTADGAALSAVFKVELRGQTDTKYVTGISICDDAGEAIDPSYRFAPGTLATAMLELQAKVTVMDPAAGASQDYQVTSANGLASQTAGELPDLLWESADTRLGTVSDQGAYRPAVTGTNIVYAYSNAGFNGMRVTAQAVIDMPAAEGEEAANGYHPQDTLTVKVCYEQYPDQQVAEKAFSVEDLEALGTVTQTYTALRGANGYLTTTGRGPLLSKVLKAAGVNTDGVARLRFGTPDNYQGIVSWDMLVDTDRYYFPNLDIGSYADGVQVAPMVAIDAFRNVGTDTSPHYDGLTDTRRFLLLFGAKNTGETTTNLQVYNIHTLYVELAGAPPVQTNTFTVKFVDSLTNKTLKSVEVADPDSVEAPAAPEHDGYTFKGWSKSKDAAGNVTYTTIYDKDRDRDRDRDRDKNRSKGQDKDADKDTDAVAESGSDDPEDPGSGGQDDGDGEGDGSDEGDGSPGGGENGAVPSDAGGDDAGAGQGDFDLVNANQTGAGADAGAGKARIADIAQSNVTELAPQDLTTINAGRWSMLQAINKHPSNVAELMADNPLAPYAAPVTAGVLAAGGVEAFARFAWQKRKPKALG